MTQVQCADLSPGRAPVRPLRGSGRRLNPSRRGGVAFLIAKDFRHRNFFSQLAQFVATLRCHCHVQLRAAGRMTQFVVLEAGEKRIFSLENTCPRRDVLRDLIDRIRLMRLPRREVRLGMTSTSRDQARRTPRCASRALVAQNENRRAVFARDVRLRSRCRNNLPRSPARARRAGCRRGCRRSPDANHFARRSSACRWMGRRAECCK